LFLSRVSVLTRDIDIAILSSVRHVSVFYGNDSTYIVIVSSPHDSPNILV